MKIGLVCPYDIYKGGGVQECVLALQEGLSKRGHDCLVITPQPKGSESLPPPFVRFMGKATDVKSPFHTTAQVTVNVDPKSVDDLLEMEKFDVLHFHEPWVPLLSRQILTRSKAKTVATFHAKLPDTVMSKTIERAITPYTKFILKYLDVLTAVSDPAAEYVRGLTHKPITIIPNGINLSKYQASSHDAARKRKTILYVGRLERRKGVAYLLRAFALLSQTSNVELVIAGDGPDKTKLSILANNLELSNVKFLGLVSEEQKLKLIAQADLFCSPALYGESFGIVLLEAMAAGLPIVAGNNPGYATVLTGRGQLSLVNPRDTVEFARRLGLMLEDEVLRKAWQDWAAEHVKQFDYGRVVKMYEKLYAESFKS